MSNYLDEFTWDMVHESATIDGVKVFNPVIAAYRNVIRDGLPTPRSKVGTVCIVGGGMSGLVAADLLSGAGYDVTILEAATRIGGRVHTVAFKDGDVSEAGAMRLLEDYQLVFDYIDRLGLQKHIFYNHDPEGQDWIAVNGVKVRRADYEKDPDCVGFPTQGEERGKTADVLWSDALAPVMAMVDQSRGLDTPGSWEKVIERYGRYSVYTYLKEEVQLSQGAIDMITVMLFLEARMHLSLLQQVVEAVDHRPDAKYYGLDGGMATLPKALLASITAPGTNRGSVTVKFGAFVRSLKQSACQEEVEVSWLEQPNAGAPAEPGCGNDQIFGTEPQNLKSQTFDAAIVTCTPPAIRRMEFTPALPSRKQKALRELNFSASTKIFLQFSEKFWLADGFAHGSSLTDTAIRAVYYPSTDDSHIVIASYTWAEAARGWDSLTAQQRVDQALDDLVALHGESIRALFVAGQSYSWLLDRFSMGEAAMIFPEQLPLQAALASPVGNIFFAGDTLSFKVAWIEGAIESGMRAALELAKLPPLRGVGLLDCTLRDGGYMNDWSFTREQAATIAKMSAAAGLEVVEIGYRNGPGSDPHAGESGECTNEYIAAMRAAIGPQTTVSVMFHALLVEETDFTQMKQAGVDLVRCILPVDKDATAELEKCFAMMDFAKSIGLRVGANITYETEYTPDDVLALAGQVLQHNVDFLYIADSNGAMIPSQTRKLFAALRLLIPSSGPRLGFHNHNMMGLAISNAMAAVEEGATLIDATYRGMGRSAGNVPLETFSGVLNRGGYTRDSVDQLQALHAAEYVETNIPDSVPAPTVQDTAFGVYDFNELEGQYFVSASESFGLSILDLLAYAASQDVDRRALSQDVVNDLARELCASGTP